MIFIVMLELEQTSTLSTQSAVYCVMMMMMMMGRVFLTPGSRDLPRLCDSCTLSVYCTVCSLCLAAHHIDWVGRVVLPGNEFRMCAVAAWVQ